MLVTNGKEAFSYVCFHVLAVWRLVPYDVSLSVFPLVWCLAGGFIVGEVVVVTFKLRYRNHICSFRNERYRNAIELSKHVWNLKDQNIKFDIKWRKVKQARSYSNVTKKCNLCLWEKYFIIC